MNDTNLTPNIIHNTPWIYLSNQYWNGFESNSTGYKVFDQFMAYAHIWDIPAREFSRSSCIESALKFNLLNILEMMGRLNDVVLLSVLLLVWCLAIITYIPIY